MIRLAKVEDIPRLEQLLYQVHDVHVNIRPDLFKKDCKKYNKKELLNIISSNDKPIFVFVEKDIIEGYAFCIITDYKNSNSLMPYKNLYIDDLCVDRLSRGKGIGTKLYQYVLDYASNIGCYNVTLNVWNGNNEALQFYKSLGMEIQKIGMEKKLKNIEDE